MLKHWSISDGACNEDQADTQRTVCYDLLSNTSVCNSGGAMLVSSSSLIIPFSVSSSITVLLPVGKHTRPASMDFNVQIY